jgi:hypothetical protein
LASCETVGKEVVEVMEIDMTIHDIVSEYDGITLVGQLGERMKILLNEDERELLKERLEENA